MRSRTGYRRIMTKRASGPAGAGMLAACLMVAGCGGALPRPPGPAVVAADGIPLAALPKQDLGRGECGLFLWKQAPNPRLILMAKSAPAPFARIILDGRPLDLPRIGGGDIAADPAPRFGDGRVTASLELTIEPRRGLSDGAVISAGAVRIDRSDGDGFVVPVSGLLACG